MKRTSAMVGVAILAVLGGAASAAADELYPPQPEPTLSVSASSVCIGDAPYLSWQADHGSEKLAKAADGKLTIRFLNPDGNDYVLTDQPLNGQILWPGAAVDSEGKATDWPGWRYENGEWLEGDEWDWVVPTADIEFTASPSVILTVDYPLPSAACAGPGTAEPPAGPREDEEDEEDEGLPDVLGRTGSEVLGALAVTAGLVGLGAVLVTLRRRTQH